MKKEQIYQLNKEGIAPAFVNVREPYFVSDNDFVNLAVNGKLRDELLESLGESSIYISRIGVFDRGDSSYKSYFDDFSEPKLECVGGIIL